MGLLTRDRELVVGLAGVTVCMIVLFLGSALGRDLPWDTCFAVVDGVQTDTCDCERLTGGLVQQPSSSWATFSFTQVGLYLRLVVPSTATPDAVIQGHAVWHLLSAAQVFFLYEHFRSEVVRWDTRHSMGPPWMAHASVFIISRRPRRPRSPRERCHGSPPVPLRRCLPLDCAPRGA